MKQKNILFLAGLLFFLLALRLGIILTSVELISHYDELDLGTIARDLARGLYVPFWYYQLDAYSGEALILGPLVLPFAKLFGENIFAIKMVPLVCSLLTLCAFFTFTLRYFGEKAARYAGLLFVLAPPGLVQLSLCNMAGHSEAFFTGFLALFCFYEFFYKSRHKTFLLLSGFTAGFAVWFYYANAIIVLSCLIIFFISDRRLFFRSMPLYSLAFLTAFSPWIISNFRNHFMGVELVAENLSGFGAERWLHIVKKPAKLILLNLPLSLATLPVYFIPRNFFAYVYYLCLLAAVFPLAAAPFREMLKKKLSAGPQMFFWIYPAVYLFMLTASRFDFDREIGFVGYRYATPLIFILLLAAAAGCSLSARGRRIFILLLALGFIGQSALLFKEPFGRAFAYQGYSYYQLGTRWHFNLSHAFTSYEDFQEKTKKFPADERRLILWGITQMARWNAQELLFLSRPGCAPDITVQNMALKETRDYEPFAYEWMGSLEKFALPKGLELLQPVLKEIPEESRKYFCQGWLWGPEQAGKFIRCPDCYPGKNICDILELERALVYISDVYGEEGKPRLAEIAAFKDEERKRAYRGLGHSQFSADVVPGLNPLNKVPIPLDLGEIAAKDRPHLYWGIGWGIREKFLEDKIRALDWIEMLSENARASALEGLEAFERWYGLE